MIDKKYINILGVIILLIISGAAGYYIKDTGEKTYCRAGFQEYNTTHWSCETSAGFRYELCFEVYNSTNTENYWCKKGYIDYIENQ